MTKEVVQSLPARENLEWRLDNPPGVLVVGLKGEGPYLESLHPRIQNRVKLHQLGVCSLPTAIFPEWGSIMGIDLSNLLTEFNKLNEKIGLPNDAERLVMRTRPWEDKFATPMGLFGFDDDSGGWIDSRTGLEFFEWYDKLPYRTSLLIHPDQPDLQKRSIHGRFFRGKDGGEELVLATGVVHMRAANGVMGSELKFDGRSGIVDLFADYAKLNGSLVKGDMMRRMVNPWLDFLKQAYVKIEEAFGKKGPVIEFRLYPNDGLHIYDVDFGF